MKITEQLREAQQRMSEAEAVWQSDLQCSDSRERYIKARRELLIAERLAAAAEEEQHAVEWLVNGEWPRIAQGAVVITGSFACVLTFDGSAGAVQVVFQDPDAVRFSCVSDEVITGHPLFGKGLSAYGLFKVVNSTWIAELRTCDAVHPQHDPSRWESANHYMLCFKDRMCEVITIREPIWKSFATKTDALREALVLHAQAT